MLRKLHRLLLVAAATGLLAHCDKSPESTVGGGKSPVLATVAGGEITEEDLREEAEWRARNRQPVPEPAELLDEMINRRAMLAKARSEGLDEEADTRRRIESMLIARLREQHLDKEVADASVSEEEVRKAYESQSSEFATKSLDRFAVLFLESSSKSSAQSREEVRKRLEEGITKSDAQPASGGRGPAATGFGAVATEYSDDQIGRYRGGDIGWIEEGASSARVPDEVLETGRGLNKGERSEIIDAEDGFYVIMKTDSRPGGVAPFNEAAPGIHRNLLVEKRRAIEERFIQDLVEGAKVSRNQEAIDKIKPFSFAPARTSPGQPEMPGTITDSPSR